MILAALVLLLLIIPAYGQHNHGAGHDEYKDWSSRKVQSCCSDRDCGAMLESEVQETPTGTQILISGTWCPVLREHYLTRGKSPDWNTPHACITPLNSYNAADPCGRLLCFTGKGGF